MNAVLERADVLEFDEVTHTYRIGGVLIPNVTRVLELLDEYRGVHPDTLARGAERGSNVHKATAAYDLGTLDADDLEPEIVPYVAAWVDFREREKIEIIDIETRDWHPQYRYAGTRDRKLIYRDDLSILDVKTTAQIMRSGGPQTAAYKAIDDHRFPKQKTKRRFSLQLRPDGTYRLHEWTDRSDLSVFLSCLTVHNFRSPA